MSSWDDPDGAHSGGGQVEPGRRTESARSEQQHLGVEQLELSFDSDLRQQQMTLVAVALFRGQRARRLPGSALVFPAVETADQGDDVGVAHVEQGLGPEGRARPAGAVDHHRLRLVGDPALDLELEEAAG
jgi:hypothetical protein